jgi:hypothetical protein
MDRSLARVCPYSADGYLTPPMRTVMLMLRGTIACGHRCWGMAPTDTQHRPLDTAAGLEPTRP